MKYAYSFYSLFLFAIFLMTGCKSSSVVSKESKLSSVAYVNSLAAKNVPSQVISAKTDVEISLGGKKVNVNGSLKMKRDALVQLSFTFLGFEVGRMEFTPSEVLLVDRANKRYVRASYADVDLLKEAIDCFEVNSNYTGSNYGFEANDAMDQAVEYQNKRNSIVEDNPKLFK
jgi:hypothetical protein